MFDGEVGSRLWERGVRSTKGGGARESRRRRLEREWWMKGKTFRFGLL